MCFKAIFQYCRGGNISPRIWDGLEPAIGYNEIMPNTNTNANVYLWFLMHTEHHLYNRKKMGNIKWRDLCFPCGRPCCGVMWLIYLSPTGGHDSFGLLGCPLLPCHSMCCADLVEERDIQSLTAPQEHDCETLASRFPVLSMGISSLRKTNKRMVAYKWALKSVIYYWFGFFCQSLMLCKPSVPQTNPKTSQ